MESKIFKHGVFALIASIVISTAALAQAAPVSPQTTEASADQQDDKELQKQMVDLQKQMSKLQKQMTKLQVQKNAKRIEFSAKKFSKEFKESFKDFGKDFSGSFSGMVPQLMNQINNNININTDVDINTSTTTNGNQEDYNKRVASGDIIERVKNYSKTYSVDGNDLLQISNTYGKVTVNTWNRNEFKVDVQMKFGMDNEDDVNDMVNGSSIADSKVGSTVSFKTILYEGKMRRSNNRNITINYTVYMPAGNPIDITNRFGGIVLPDLSGKALIKLSYGNLVALGLTNSQNDVVVKFGDASITNFNSGKVAVSYGKLKTGTVNNVDADIKFSSISIDRLKGSADVNVSYGDGFRIGNIDKTVKNINVDAKFTKINLNIADLNFDFDVTTKFGSFNFNDDNVKVTSKTPSDEDRGWSSTKSYKGHSGKGGADNKIVINASYTGVSFN